MTLRGAAWLVAVGVLSAAPDQQPARFRSTAEAVQVDVQVKARGKPVAGLTADDFELRDSGIRQQIQAATFEDVPVSLLLALDVSGSVQGKPLEELKDAARAAIATLRPNDQAALLSFSQRVSVVSNWTSDREVLGRAVDALAAKGRTALYDAIFTGLTLRERARGRVILLVFTDGSDTSSWLAPDSVIEAARDADLVVYALATDDRSQLFPGARATAAELAPLRQLFQKDPMLYPYAFLHRLTEETGGETIAVETERNLVRLFASVVSDFKTRYLLTYAPARVPAAGWHPIEVRLKGKSGDITARRGYFKQSTER